jgi:membrane-associated phospholipid phosphatase
MRASEYVAATAFLYFAVVCWFGTVRLSRRLLVTAVSLGLLVAVRVVSTAGITVRDCAPALFILAGYYVSGMVYVRPSERLERWLLDWDHRLLGDPTTRFSKWPPLLLAYLDLVYTLCFALLPAGLAALLFMGHRQDVDRYWTIVSIAELGAFMPLAFIQTRPPWVIERPADLPDGAVRHMAEQAVRRVSHGVNTFPSGHASGSVAIALALSRTMPAGAAVFLALAGSIAVACVVGRYHYSVDVVAGIALALGVWAVTLAVGM